MTISQKRWWRVLRDPLLFFTAYAPLLFMTLGGGLPANSEKESSKSDGAWRCVGPLVCMVPLMREASSGSIDGMVSLMLEAWVTSVQGASDAAWLLAAPPNRRVHACVPPLPIPTLAPCVGELLPSMALTWRPAFPSWAGC